MTPPPSKTADDPALPNLSGLKALHVVEAALFSAGRAVSLREICDETGLKAPAVRQAIDELRTAYEERDTVLEVSKAGDKWAMQVRTKAADDAARFAPMEIPKKVLKTLALIAYHQPVKQSDLKDMIGSKVYDHIPELKEHGLVKTRRDGQTKIISTTPQFPEYFGLDAATPQQIRAVMAKMVGIDPDAEPRKSHGLEAYGGESGQDEAAAEAGAVSEHPEEASVEIEA